MPKRPNMYEKRTEEMFLQDAILDLRHGETTYVYTKYILDELKKIFKDLDITRNEFYWRVRNNEVINER